MNFNMALIFGLILEFIIAIVAASGYFFYYVKMPEYSINQAKKAVQEGNLREFEKYVDVSRLMKEGVQDAAMYVPQSDGALQSMLKSGQMAAVLQKAVEEYVKNGQWGEIQGLSDPKAKELVEQCGLTTFNFRGIEYIRKGVDPLVVNAEQAAEVEVEDVGIIDKALDGVDSAIHKVETVLGIVDDVQASVEDLQDGKIDSPNSILKPSNSDSSDGYTGQIAEAGIIVYDKTLGDNIVIRLKLMELNDGSWRVVDIANYGEFIERMLNMNKRDMKKYCNRVNDVLIDTDREMEAYRKSHPKTDKDWVMKVTDIMKSYNEKLDLIEVPRPGEPLAELLKERKTIFFEMMDVYYESNEKRKAKNIGAKLEEVNRRWKENREAINNIIDQYKNLNL